MNRNNNIFNKYDIENKLKDFKEGQDYSIFPTDEPNIKTYNFHNDKSRSMFVGDKVPVKIAQETYDDKNYSYRGHFEEGKDYYYSHRTWEGTPPADENGWHPISSEFYSRSNGDYRKLSMRHRPLNNFEPKKIEPNFNENEVAMHEKYLAEFQEKKHNLEMINIEEQNNPKSCCEKHTQDWLKNPNRQKLIEERKKDIEVLETKIRYEKDWLAKNANGSRPQHWETCQCGQMFDKAKEYYGVDSLDRHVREVFCSHDCAEKYKSDPHGKVEYLPQTYLGKNDNNHSDLRKENQELRQQLSKVQKQLAEVLAELKKLKSEINGKDSEKLEQQMVQNEKLIKDSENISVSEIQEQVNKSQALMNEINTSVSSTKDNKGGGSLPYIIGGSVILISAGIIGYLLLKKNRGKKVV